MRSPPGRAAPLLGPAGPMAPSQLWTRLTPTQPQQVRQTLLVVGQHLLAPRTEKPPPEAPPNDCPH
jgi:hypothetical protein